MRNLTHQSHPGRQRTLRAVLAALIGLSFAVLGGTLAPSTPASAAASPTNCSYATGSPGKYANTICWLDFSSYDENQARSSSGQHFSLGLGGGFTATFDLKAREVPGSPWWPSRGSSTLENAGYSAYSSKYYSTTAGKPVLWNIVGFDGSPANSASGVQWTLDSISVVGPDGKPIQDFAFVAGDAENTAANERVSFSSDKPLNLIEELTGPAPEGCFKANTTGIGTTNVTCQGSGTLVDTPGSNLLFQAQSPTQISQTIVSASRNAGVFGVQMSKVNLTKKVASRATPGDSFTVSARSGGSTLSLASTGTTDSASTGDVQVLAGSTVTLSETGDTGTRLGDYDTAWACTRNGENDSALTPAAGATELTIAAGTAQVGDYIACTITNTAKLPAPGLSLQKTATPATVKAAGDTVTYTFHLSNTGNTVLNDVTVDETQFSGTGQLSPILCPSASLQVGESEDCTAHYTLTSADVNAGKVTNTAVGRATPPNGPRVTTPPSTAIVVVETPPTPSAPIHLPVVSG